MKRHHVLLMGWMLPLIFSAASADLPLAGKGREAVSLQVQYFALEQVRLLDGPFKRAMELDQRYLLALPVDRLLHNFYVNAGLPSTAKPLGGWEEPSCELRGHFVGHYLSACGLMYAATGDARFKAKGDSVVAGLQACQEKLGNGYLSAFPITLIDRVESGQRVWAPYYTLHKILAGLLAMQVHGGNSEALALARKLADWVVLRNGRLPDDQMQRMLSVEHGGMNEALADLYAITGEKKYLDISLRFNHLAVIDSAKSHRDALTGLHANTQIPKFIGLARQYELTGDRDLKEAASFFWKAVVTERSYVIGGHSNEERFTEKHTLSEALGPSTAETCNTHNMLKLTRHLFAAEPRIDYIDYYERALYNHILASQNPQTGMMCYYVPLSSGSRRTYNDFDSSFWCCTGTGVENHAKYGEMIYAHSGDSTLYVNLFLASRLDWPELGMQILQETRFPEQPSTRLQFFCEQPRRLTVRLRCPSWLLQGALLRINGQKQEGVRQPGSWTVIDREWREGDVIEWELPFSLYTEAFRDNPNRLAFLYGPLVLSAQVDVNQPIPVIKAKHGSTELLRALEADPHHPLCFIGRSGWFCRAGGHSRPAVILQPFFSLPGDSRYAVYWDVRTPAQFRSDQHEYEAERNDALRLDKQTIDRVAPGQASSEQEHAFAGEKCEAGDFGGRAYREAYDGGWCRYRLKVASREDQALCVQYWGSDTGARTFDLLVDGRIIATQNLNRQEPNRFYRVYYPLDRAWLTNQSEITVRFQAHAKNLAGGLYDLRIIRVGSENGF